MNNLKKNLKTVKILNITEISMKYRIMTNGQEYKVQFKKWYYLFWLTVQRPEDLDNKDFGGDKTFKTKEEAQAYIDSKQPDQWVKA